MYLTVRGVVLRTADLNDRDAILTILSSSHGKLNVKVRGLRRKNNPIVASCQILTYGEYTIFGYREKYTLNEAYAIELFRGLRKELTRLSLGTYFAQVCELLSQEDQPNPELLSLLLNCLFVLSEGRLSERMVKAVFELRAACIGGFAPALYGCHACGNSLPDRFDINAGELECAACRGEGEGIRVPVTHSVLEAMRYICASDAKRLFSFRVGQDTLTKLSAVTEAYLAAQTERGFFALDFYKSLFANFPDIDR